jgi:hypothetical protein
MGDFRKLAFILMFPSQLPNVPLAINSHHKINMFLNNFIKDAINKLYIQYWCIDGKYRIYVARLRNEGKTSFSESFHPFRASHINSIFTVNTPILYLSCNKICQKNVI